MEKNPKVWKKIDRVVQNLMNLLSREVDAMKFQ